MPDLLSVLKKIEFNYLLYALLSIFPWGLVLYLLHPVFKNRKRIIVIAALIAGIISTQVIIYISGWLWPDVDFQPRRISILSQTVHLAFIQAGMMEETFKILFIMILSLVFAFDFKLRQWKIECILIAGFVALGFSLVENYIYIAKQTEEARFSTFLGRAVYSSNIHLLINLCFALFMIKSNFQFNREKIVYLFYGYVLAIIQHGVVDFFLLPVSRFGNWVATALFVGIWVWVVQDMRKFIYKTNLFYRDG